MAGKPQTSVPADVQPEGVAKPKRTRVAVPMVTSHPDELNFEVASADEVKRTRSAEVLNDAQQQKIRKAVQASFKEDKWLVATGPVGSTREVVKRLRLAAAEFNYGMSIGLSSENDNGVRVPFKASKRREYKRKNKES